MSFRCSNSFLKKDFKEPLLGVYFSCLFQAFPLYVLLILSKIRKYGYSPAFRSKRLWIHFPVWTRFFDEGKPGFAFVLEFHRIDDTGPVPGIHISVGKFRNKCKHLVRKSADV